jgi:hypothetical protein
MPFVFTVFFCGTGSNSFDAHNPLYPDGELISTLARNHQGHEFADWIIIDGPGSGNLQEDDKWVPPGNYWKSRGTLQGKGWEENVAHAVAVIKGNYQYQRDKLTSEQFNALKKAGIPIDDPKKVGPWYWRTFDYPNRKVTPQELQCQKAAIFRKGKLPDLVNLIGWSRGGVSCHMLANAMHSDPQLQHIPVNIFAIDPVPGTTNFQRNRTWIDDNVSNYVGIYARDERSKGFAPVIPTFSGPRMTGNKPIILPLPGRHGTLVGNAAIDGSNGKQELFAPGKLVRHLAEQYLTSWGTQLTLSAQSMPDLYREIVRDDAKYIAMRSYSYTLIKENKDGEREVVKGSDISTKFSDIKGPDYLHPEGLAPVDGYLSWHHKEVSTTTLAQAKSVSTKFPVLATGLNYTFSNEPVLLNGMKVVFDRPIPVSPVTLQPKTSKE